MAETMPQNGEEAGYTAFALVDELIDVLVVNRILPAALAQQVFKTAAERLSKESNGPSNRAAQFVTNRASQKK